MAQNRLDNLSDREILIHLFQKMGNLENSVSEIKQNVQQLTEEMKQVKPILQETNQAVAIGFMEQRELLSTVKEVAVDQDEQIAQMEWLGDKAEIQEKTSLRIRQRIHLLERRVEFLEQKMDREP